MDQQHKINKIENSILQEINNCLELKDSPALNKIPLQSNVFDVGLDSMDFAIIVSELESKLNYDPFVLEESPVYPETFSQFVDIYVKHSDRLV